MKKNKYDIFISYRRIGGKNYARTLKPELEKRGFRVFLDFDELKDGVFDKRIMDAISEAPIFLVILSKGALDRCANEGDWVREEILYAEKTNRHIVPVEVDKTFRDFPENLPQDVKSVLSPHQFSQIDTETLLQESIDKMVRERIKPNVGEVHDNSAVAETESKEGAEIHIEVDAECDLLRFKKFVKFLVPDTDNVVRLMPGKHKIEFVSKEYPEIKEPMVISIPSIQYSDFLEVALADKINNKKQEEIRRQEEEKRREEAKRKAEEEAKRIAAEETRKKAEETKRKEEIAAKRKAEKERRKAEEEKRKAEELARRQAAEEAERKAAEEARRNEDAVNFLETVKDLIKNGKKETALKLLLQEEASAPERYKPYFYYHIGRLYYFSAISNGRDQSKFAEANVWFQKAAELGHIDSQIELGESYAFGYGVNKDINKAKHWYLKSGTADGNERVGELYYYGIGGVEKDYDLAKYYYEIAAEKGSPKAIYKLGNIFWYGGHGVEEDRSKSFLYYKKAAEKGYEKSFFDLGWCYFVGQGTSENFSEALKWFRNSVYAKGYKWTKAANTIGHMYCDGFGVNINYSEAVKWYQMAAEEEDNWGCQNLANMYYEGKGVERNFSEAKKWFQKALDNGINEAKEKLLWIEEWEMLCEQHDGLYRVGKMEDGRYIFNPSNNYRDDEKEKKGQTTFRCGFADKSGKEVIKCTWYWVGDFYNGRALVWNNKNKLGIIDTTCKMIMSCENKYDEVKIIDDKYVRTFEGSFYELFELETGKRIADSVTYTKMGEHFVDGYLYVEKFKFFGKDKKGKIDKEGHFIEDKS